MKKLFIYLVISTLPLVSFSQVFNTASTLKPGRFSIGLNPVVYDNYNNEFGLFLHGGVGIVPKVDFALHYGIFRYEDYFGADIEWNILSAKPSLSIITGAHKYYDAGLDLGLNLSFPITAGAHIYTGVDADINFGDHETYAPVWLPVGVEISLKSRVAFLFEAEIPLSESAWTIFGGGVAFYF
jgi:hypothetical protein